MDIQLNLVNLSASGGDTQVAIWLSNVAAGYGAVATAWKTIPCGRNGYRHAFTMSRGVKIAASDRFGNFTPRWDALPGDAWRVTQTGEKAEFDRVGPANSPQEIHVVNGLTEGAVDAHIYWEDAPLATKRELLPGEMAAFVFKPTIWIGPVAQVEQGQTVDSAVLGSVNTMFSLVGVASADIAMTGGGSGETARPLAFELQNVVGTSVGPDHPPEPPVKE